jgi:hypothetical protein
MQRDGECAGGPCMTPGMRLSLWARDCTSTAACVTGSPICGRLFLLAAVIQSIIESFVGSRLERGPSGALTGGWARWLPLHSVCGRFVHGNRRPGGAKYIRRDMEQHREHRQHRQQRLETSSPQVVVRCILSSCLLHMPSLHLSYQMGMRCEVVQFLPISSMWCA